MSTSPATIPRLRVKRHLATRYWGGGPSQPAFRWFGLVQLHKSRWSVTMLGSGATIGGGLLGVDFDVQRRGPLGCRVTVGEHEGGYAARWNLPLTSARRFRKQLAAHKERAQAEVDRQTRAQAGDWWLEPEALTDVGPSRTISLIGTSYQGGWTGGVRLYRKPRSKVLDINPSGLSLRGLYRHLLIPWEDVERLAVTGGQRHLSSLLVGLRDGGQARFENGWYSPSELAAAIVPVTRQMRSDAG
jgi:hypothetical protein